MNRTSNTQAPFGHEEARLLLPWFVNGTLSEDERAKMQRHVRDCLSCRAELNSERRLSELLGQRVHRDLEAEAGYRGLQGRIGEDRAAHHSRSPRRLWALAASIAAAAILGAWLGVSFWPGERVTGFETVTDAPAAAARLDIVFRATAGARERDALISEFGLTVVSGPSEIGRYTVEIAGDAESLIAELQDDERVMFAGPSFISD